jgi:putative transposase
MSSYRQIYYHIVFGTKYHQRTIPDEHCEDLYKYIAGIIRNKQCKLYQINGSQDHIHLLSDLHPTIALADYIKDIKIASSIWLKTQEAFSDFKSWSEGYGAFTVSHKDRDLIIEYIKGQKEHHKKSVFRDEYKQLLFESGIDFDEKYLM